MKVRVFAALRELAGAGEVVSDAPDVAALLEELEARWGPRFAEIMRTGAVIVNGEPAAHGRALGPGDEVALLPPVSGGIGSRSWVLQRMDGRRPSGVQQVTTTIPGRTGTS